MTDAPDASRTPHEPAATDPSAAVPPRTPGRNPLWGALLLAVALTAGALAAAGPVALTVDGRTRWVPRGATVARLSDLGVFTAPRGSLVSVTGSVLARGGGEVQRVRSGEAVLDPRDVVGPGAVLVSEAGADVREPVAAREETVPPTVEHRGSGRYERLESSGTPGRVRVTFGGVSGLVAHRALIDRGQPAVVLHERVWRGGRVIALTFDDGPWPVYTDRIVQALRERGARATFFMLGSCARRRPEMARRVVEAGMEVGNHSQMHTLLRRATPAVARREIRAGGVSVERATGVRPVWYRPAGGSVNPGVYREARRLGYRLVLWDIDTSDYRKPPVSQLVRRVVGQARPGAIVLMHDGGGDRRRTAAAVPRIVDELQRRGYTLVTVSEILGPVAGPAETGAAPVNPAPAAVWTLPLHP